MNGLFIHPEDRDTLRRAARMHAQRLRGLYQKARRQPPPRLAARVYLAALRALQRTQAPFPGAAAHGHAMGVTVRVEVDFAGVIDVEVVEWPE